MPRCHDIGRLLVQLILLSSLSSGAGRADDLYAISGVLSPHLQKVDPGSGSVLTSSPFAAGTVLNTLCDDGTSLFAIDGFNDNVSDRLFRIDAVSGAGVVVGNTLHNWNRRSCDVRRSEGELYAITDSPGPTPCLYRIDRTTGEATVVACSAFVPELDRVTAMAISPAGVAYVTDTDGTSLFRLELSSANLTFIGNAGFTGARTEFNDLAFDSGGQLWGVRGGGGLYRIDTATGIATFVAPTTDWSGLAFRWADPVSTRRTTWCRLKGLYR